MEEFPETDHKGSDTINDRLKFPLDCQEVVEVSVVGPGRKKWTAAEWSASEG